MLPSLNKHSQVSVGPSTRYRLLIALLAITGLLQLLVLPAFSARANTPGQWRWSGVERIVVVPDIHGAYPEFTQLLEAAGVVDSSLQWIAGDTHLVSLGDLLDRGAESRKVMDLLMRLQNEAPEHGGRVHVVAGNHDSMNLLGDLRYVAAAEFAAFAEDESADQRSLAYEEFMVRRSDALSLGFLKGGLTAAQRDPKTRQEFEEVYPPGYFGHREAFAEQGHYGRWLLSLPALIVINRTVFVHGGLPAVTATAPLDELNLNYQRDLRRYFELWPQLIDTGLLSHDISETNFAQAIKALRIADPSSCSRQERSECARERGSATDRQRNPTAAELAVLRELVSLRDSPMIGPTGPQWYRGSVRCKDILEIPVLQAALDNLGAERVVVGHTPTTDRRVHRIRQDKLFMLDTGMLVSRYRGRPAALLIEQDDIAVQYLNPSERVAPLGEGGNGVYPLGRDQLREALRLGALVDVNKGWFGSKWDIELAYNGVTLKAEFFPDNGQGSDQREMAAYRLDELLGFGLVPITVDRQIAGEVGVLQLAYRDFLTESQLRRQRLEASRWCPRSPQQQLLEIFDLLIGNTARSSSSMGYARPLWNLQATGHDEAFGLVKTLPESSTKQAYDLPRSVREALLALNQVNLVEALGQQLGGEQITALLARRDAILEIMSYQAESYDPPAQAARDDRRQ